ncbi:MAG: CopG family transcriptional regulator [candidate division NC10 bacterium]|nr:CopG family transcriptional regulator [candidate division NC10 bacterium]
MPTTVRLDPETESLIRRLARKTGRTKSQVIRDAIRALAGSEAPTEAAGGPYEAVAHLIGCVSGGPKDLSERTGEKFRKLLLERARS